jgi:dTDP-4-amino-4,6-dideoxygalactose transaminase
MPKLAIDGGPKVIKEPLAREWPGLNWIGKEERKLVLAALEGSAFSGDLSAALKKFYKCPSVSVTNSGTTALFNATAALALRPGMEVLVPGFCWVPTFGCVVSRGAIPVLVDVGEDLNIDPADMERKITDRTAAVIVVHMCGAAADMDRVMRVARRHKLLVIEDCAQNGAGNFKGKRVGLFGDVGCFSLQQNKHFTSFLGGYSISKRAGLQEALDLTRDQGMPRVMNVIDPTAGADIRWGMGLWLNPLGQAMAIAQLRKAPRIIAAMQRSQRRIIARIGSIPGLTFRRVADPANDSGAFLITFWPDGRTARRAAAALKAEGVPEWIFHLQDYGAHMYYHIRPLVEKVGWSRGGPCPWKCPFNKGSHYSYKKGALPKSDAIFARGVVMAVPSKLTQTQCAKIAEAYRKVAAHLLA